MKYMLPFAADYDVYRHPYSDAEDAAYVPRIPVQPISYGDAVHFMSQLPALQTTGLVG